jgi:amino acid adenylation domain-containing protein
LELGNSHSVLPPEQRSDVRTRGNPLRLPRAFQVRFAANLTDATLALYGFVLSCLCRQDSFDVSWRDQPLRIEVDASRGFAGLVRSVAAQRAPLGAPRERPMGAFSAASGDLTLVFDGGAVPRLVADGGGAAERLAAFASQLWIVAQKVALAPERPLDEIDLLDEAQRQRQLFQWNDTVHPVSSTARIHDAFEARAAEAPDRPALVCEGQTLSFGAVERGANQVAAVLRARGAGPRQFVGLFATRGFDLAIGMLGIVKAGAAYVPVDPALPDERVRFMLEDAGCALVLCSSELAPRLAAAGVAAAVVAVDGDQVRGASGARHPCPAAAGDPCYAIYTSGSTGQPKGVVLSHRAVVNTLEWVNRTMRVGPDDRLLFVTSPSFDLSVYDLFGALGAGASVEIASPALLAEPAALVARLCAPGVTIWNSAPPTLARLVPLLPETAPGSRLRLVMLSGDWIPVKLPDRLRRTFADAQVESLGGATEAAIWSNHFHVGEVDPTWTSIPYGRPIQNARYYVLDHHRRPLPVGVPGELYIAGACLANGYLNRPELTQQRFVPDPFHTGERMYRTGDLARYGADGTMELIGRVDQQVKIRGFRVELGELEARIAAQPSVVAVACAPFADASGEKALCAYVVPRGTPAGFDVGALRAALVRALPAYMIPTAIVPLPALPLSPNGKLDRRALPSPLLSVAGEPFVAPRDALERDLVAIWEGLLQHRPIGIRDDFFALGGQSLLAVMLVAEIKQKLGVEIPLSTIVEHVTIESLAATIAGPRDTGRPRGNLLRLSSGGSRPPLVMVAGIGGYAFTYQPLARALGPEQAMLALQGVGVDGAGAASSVEEIAAIYEQEVTAAIPEGPLVIGGFSFGALPAFALARRLQRRGRQVPLIISLDGFAPNYPERAPLGQRLRAHAREVWRRDWRGRFDYVRDRAVNVYKRVLLWTGRAQQLAPAQPFADPAVRDRMKQLWAIQMRAHACFRTTEVADSDVLLFRAAQTETWAATKMDDPACGWRARVRGAVTIVTIPGDHEHLLAPENRPLIAAAIRRHLDGPSRR